MNWPVGGGATGAMIRTFDWSKTSLGCRSGWPQSLKTSVDIVLAQPLPLVMLWGPEGVMIYNDAYAVFAGRRHPNLLGSPVLEGWPEIADFNRHVMQVGLAGQTLSMHDQHLVLNRGEVPEDVWMDLSYSPILDENGRAAGVLAIVIETTERVRAQERLQISQTAGRIGSFEWYPETGRLDVSDEYRRIWGIPAGVAITDRMLVELVHEEDRKVTGPARFGTDVNPLNYAEYRITRPDTGEMRWIARRGQVLQADGSGPQRFVGVAFDISERKAAEAAQQESETRFRLMADSAPALIWACDQHGRLTFINRRYEVEFGMAADELLREGLRQIILEDDVGAFTAKFQDDFAARRPFTAEVRVWSKTSGLRWLRCEGVPRFDGAGAFVGYVGANVDITEARLAADALEAQVSARTKELQEKEEALRQSQKMEAIGQLTGGIAHDFNNLLQGIIGGLDLAQTRIAQGRTGEVERFLAAAVSSANRAAALTHRLLAFSRRQPLDPKPTKVNHLLASIEDLLRRTLGASIELQFDLAAGLWLTKCDGNQLESAILNLAINARDAMPEGGRLLIETGNADIDGSQLAELRDVAPGHYIRIAVTDSGTGMPPAVMARAFDPFFTTKPTGQGTGLGLSMVYGFARQSEGYAKIRSEVGTGTTVKIFLPRYLGEMVVEAEEKPGAEKGALADGEVVLVVEDETVVRGLILGVLEDLGYNAIEAADGPEALKVLQSDARIDLLVTDIGLPGLNGRQVVDAARDRRRDLPVLFMTGYAESAAMARGFLEPGMQMMTKPFTMEALASRIRTIFERAR